MLYLACSTKTEAVTFFGSPSMEGETQVTGDWSIWVSSCTNHLRSSKALQVKCGLLLLSLPWALAIARDCKLVQMETLQKKDDIRKANITWITMEDK